MKKDPKLFDFVSRCCQSSVASLVSLQQELYKQQQQQQQQRDLLPFVAIPDIDLF